MALYPGECNVKPVNLDQDITICFGMMPLFDNVDAIIAVVGRRPSIERCTGCCNDELMYVVIRITISVINSCMVIKVVMSAKVRSSASIFYSGPKSIALIRKIVETIGMQSPKSLFVAGEEDMRFCICL